MSIKPILFNTDMIRAILDGKKTVTRRCVKPQIEKACPHCQYIHNEFIYDFFANNVYCARCGNGLIPQRKPPCQPGDILYVRETWAKAAEIFERDWHYEYRADTECEYIGKWRPSIHMPKEAARIWLKVTDVRVERLLRITEEQAIKEGFEPGSCQHEGAVWGQEDGDEWTAKTAFIALWDSTIPKKDLDTYGWNANPWVWVIEFEWCEKPEEV